MQKWQLFCEFALRVKVFYSLDYENRSILIYSKFLHLVCSRYTEHLRKILYTLHVIKCVFLGTRHYSTCPKPFPVFLSWESAVTALVYGYQKPWLLPWQCHTEILCAGRLRLLQHRHENRSENGERCRRNLLNANQPLHSLSFTRPKELSGSTLYLRSQSLSILEHTISIREEINFFF